MNSHIPDTSHEMNDRAKDVTQQEQPIGSPTVPRPTPPSQHSPPTAPPPSMEHSQDDLQPSPNSTSYPQSLSQFSQPSQPLVSQPATQFSVSTSQFQAGQLGSTSPQTLQAIRKSLLFDNSANSLSFFSGNTFTTSKSTQPPGLPPPGTFSSWSWCGNSCFNQLSVPKSNCRVLPLQMMTYVLTEKPPKYETKHFHLLNGRWIKGSHF